MQALDTIEQVIKREFEARKVILGFEDYLNLVAENPQRHLRSSAQYLVDMMDHYKKTALEDGTTRFHLFDITVDGIAPKVVGQEVVQTRIYDALRSFVSQGLNNKLLLLHGPNGSAKTTIIRSLMAAAERYSHEEEGALYTFNWVFPAERITKKGMGIQAYDKPDAALESYATLSDDEIAARFPCELKDHPILVIPSEYREKLLEEILGRDKARKVMNALPYALLKGDMSHRSRMIFNALVTSNAGDFKKVLRHIQVERIFLSRRYRRGLVTIEPQLHVDAHYSQLTYNKSLSGLPSSLQGLNLFEIGGDLVDGNRGMIEYNDLLKRPLDSYKYLLGSCESNSVTVGGTIAYLDLVMIGSSNELQLDGFKEFPDFSSFKARIELIRVPYLLRVSQEQEIYSLVISQVAGQKHVSPHVASSLALWAVLTRLKKPNSINYPPNMSSIISALTPLQKARLYDSGELPMSSNPEERKLLRSNIDKLKDEYALIPYYEGRMGASPREIRSLLLDAVQNTDYPCLSPLAVFHELEELVKKVGEYDFLKQDIKDGYHDAVGFAQTVRDEYLATIDKEIRSCIGLYDAVQWEDFLRRYILHLSHLLKQEKVHNPVTGRSEPADAALIAEFESIVDAPKGSGELEGFRRNIISTVGAWALDHPKEKVIYAKVFPEYWGRLEKHYYDSQKGLLLKMYNALQVYGTDQHDPHSEGSQLAKQTIENMKEKMGYCDNCAKEAINFYMKHKHMS